MARGGSTTLAALVSFYPVRILAIALGGALGAVLRFQVAGWVERSRLLASGRFFGGVFPWGTLLVNLSGCLLIGFLAGLLQQRLLAPPDLRAFVLVGCLGGYTTFSTFALETLRLIHSGSWELALVNGLGSPILGLVGVWIGAALVRAL